MHANYLIINSYLKNIGNRKECMQLYFQKSHTLRKCTIDQNKTKGKKKRNTPIYFQSS